MPGMRRRDFISAARRRGGRVAARGARAAAGADAADRCIHEPGLRRCGRPEPHRGIPARAAGAGLVRRPQRADRLSLGWQQFDADRMRKDAADLLALAPDVVFAATGTDRCGAAAGEPDRSDRLRGGRSIRSARAWSTAWRGRAATPPVSSCSSTASARKWLELLKEISPGVKRVAVLRDADSPPASASLPPCRLRRRRFGVELQPIDVRDAGEFERALADFARAPNGGLIVPLSTSGDRAPRADRHAGGSAPTAGDLSQPSRSSPSAA